MSKCKTFRKNKHLSCDELRIFSQFHAAWTQLVSNVLPSRCPEKWTFPKPCLLQVCLASEGKSGNSPFFWPAIGQTCCINFVCPTIARPFGNETRHQSLASMAQKLRLHEHLMFFAGSNLGGLLQPSSESKTYLKSPRMPRLWRLNWWRSMVQASIALLHPKYSSNTCIEQNWLNKHFQVLLSWTFRAFLGLCSNQTDASALCAFECHTPWPGSLQPNNQQVDREVDHQSYSSYIGPTKICLILGSYNLHPENLLRFSAFWTRCKRTC